MKTYPFGLLVDGSNDTGVEKLNPLTVQSYFKSESESQPRFAHDQLLAV